MSFCVRVGPPALKISAGIKSDPGALSFERESIAFWNSDSFGGSAKEVLISTYLRLASNGFSIDR